MSDSRQPAEILSTLLMLPVGELKPETSLEPLNTSLGMVRLALALRRAGLSLPGNKVPPTFRDLERVLRSNENEASAASGPVSVSAQGVRLPGSPHKGLKVGLDIQEIQALPAPADYWADEFYRENFDRSEIAYAVVRAEPRTHLAGFWCAREALRKCDPAFAGASPASTAVAHDPGGQPYLILVTETTRARLPHALSISHTGATAAAVVILNSADPAPPETADATEPGQSSPPLQPVRSPAPVLSAGVLFVLAIAAVLALWRSLL